MLPGIAAGVAALLVVTGSVSLYHFRHNGNSTPVADPPVKPEQVQSQPSQTAQKEAPTDQAAKPPTDVSVLASNLKKPLSNSSQSGEQGVTAEQKAVEGNAARLASFMKVDPAISGPIRASLTPVTHDNIDPKLWAIARTPLAEDELRFSPLLRRSLANRRAAISFMAGDISKARTIVSTLVDLPPVAPDIIDNIANFGFGTVLAKSGASQNDLVMAGRLFANAASHGHMLSAITLASRNDVASAASIGNPSIERFLRLAALQNPGRVEELAKQRNIDIGIQKRALADFNNAVANRDWLAVSTIYQYAAAPQIPWFDAYLGQRLMMDPNHDGYVDRALVGSVIGALSDYREGYDMLSVFCQQGLGGVPNDAPNAAGWMILALAGLRGDEPNWAGGRERFEQIKAKLSDDQRESIEHLQREFKVVASEHPNILGEATMLPDKTIVLTFWRTGDGKSAHAVVRYPVGDENYQIVFDHLGGIKPGEKKLVSSFDETGR